MKLIRPSSGLWGFAELSEFELSLLAEVPACADPGDSEAAQDRILPNPFLPGSEGDDPEFQADWNEYVTAGLIDRFQSDIATLAADLRKVELIPGSEQEDEDGDATYRLDIPDSHAGSWLSALNQGRLVLNEKHDLYRAEKDGSGGGSAGLSLEDRPFGGDEPGGDLHRRWRAHLQSQFYGFIQEWLIARVLDVDAEGDDADLGFEDDEDEDDIEFWEEIDGIDD